MNSSPATSRSDAPEVRLLWPLAARLGEGPIWIEAEQSLWFVDIEGRSLHRYLPSTDQRDTITMPGRPSFLLPANDCMVLGMDLALHRMRDGALAGQLAVVTGARHCRTNDATVDPSGRLWFGTMDLAQRSPTGQVHVYDGTSVRAVGGQCPITNGPAVSPDGKLLYHVDTLAGEIWVFDISTSETLSDGRVFAAIAPEHGYPDGVTVDAEGGVWVALWGGAAVRRYSPRGECLQTVAIPASQVTKIAFGGADLRTAFVTTARIGLSDEALAAQPHAGGLFAFEAPVAGLPANKVRL